MIPSIVREEMIEKTDSKYKFLAKKKMSMRMIDKNGLYQYCFVLKLKYYFSGRPNR